jgi:VWFA-related protein
MSLAALVAIVHADLSSQQVTEPRPGRVLIDAVALDRNGLPVQDLRREDLEVWIGGYRVPIDTLTAVSTGDDRPRRSLVLLLDDVTIEPVVVARAREAARRFVARVSPGDRISIVTLGGSVVGPTDGQATLSQGIDRYNQRLTGLLRRDELGAQVLTMLTSVSRQLAKELNRRHTIVAIGSAWLFDTPLPPPGSTLDLHDQWIEAMRSMASANVNFYVIDPSGVGLSPVPGGDSGFAREAGGRTYVNTNDFNGAADQILREADNYYLIGVRDPPIGRKADLRQLEVRSLRRGVTLRARKAIPGAQ